MQANHLREGSGLLCVRYSRDGLAGGDLGWDQGNHIPSQSPTGLQGLLSREGVAGGLAQSPEEQGLPVAMKGHPLGWDEGPPSWSSSSIPKSTRECTFINCKLYLWLLGIFQMK